MKLRATKGKGAITENELADYARGLICLTGGEYGPLTEAIPNKNGVPTLERLIDIFGRKNVGKNGVGPFKTYLKLASSEAAIRRFSGRH